MVRRQMTRQGGIRLGKNSKEFKPDFSPLNPRPNRTPHTLTSSAIANTGCSDHYLMMTSSCANAKPATNGLSVLLPDGGTRRQTTNQSATLRRATSPSLPCPILWRPTFY
jgi:hypothetical protein